MKGFYLISTLVEKRVKVFRAINNERKETWGQCGFVSGEKVAVINSIFFENPVGGFLRLRMMKKNRVNFCLKMSGKKMIF